MTNIGLQEAFEIEIKKLDDNLTKPTSNISEYFLNAGLDKYWKSRYSNNNFKGEGFEQTQKRIDDLRTLVTKLTYSNSQITSVSKYEFTVVLPDNYLVLLGDTASIAPSDGMVNDCWDKDTNGNYILRDTDTIEGTIETVDRIKENSLSEYHLHYTKAKPIRLIANNNIILYTDGQYKVSKYNISYLRQPEKINIHNNPFVEYTDMPEHTHIEIVKMAAQLYLENQQNPRYQTYMNETNTME